jgi:hypothetical protein
MIGFNPYGVGINALFIAMGFTHGYLILNPFGVAVIIFTEIAYRFVYFKMIALKPWKGGITKHRVKPYVGYETPCRMTPYDM